MSAESRRAVFLSYASQDAEAARRICDALRTAGVEVWFDQSELRGGDAWDAKIRGQIASCALFVPVISAATQARREGYFRIEWRLAAQRTHAIAEGTPFLMPVLIDDTREPAALVPAEFRGVQWTRLPEGEKSAAFCERVKHLLHGSEMESGRPRPAERDGVYPPSAAPEATRGVASPVKTKPRRAWLMLAAVALVALCFAGWRWSQSRHASAPVPDNSVAVLAFTNLSADKSNEYFSDGISEEICRLLGSVPGLRVPSTASSFTFKGHPVPPAEMGRQLSVAYLVDGSVQKDGDRVRIRARLLHARDGLPLWTSENYDRALTDLFKVQDEIAGLIVRQLRGNLRYAVGTHSAQVRPEAFQLYLQGRQAWSLRGIISQKKAGELFAAAIELDPKFGRAYAGLVDARTTASLNLANVNQRQLMADRGSPYRKETTALAETAVRLDPNSAETHAARGGAYRAVWDFLAAEASLRTALRLNPSYAHAHYSLGILLMNQGRMDEGLQSFARGTDLDPLSSRMQDFYSRALRLAGRTSLALERAEQAIKLDPDSALAHGMKISALLALDRVEDAVTAAREALERDKATPLRSFEPAAFVVAYVRAGRKPPTDLLPEVESNNYDVMAAGGRHAEILATLHEDKVYQTLIPHLLYSTTFDLVRREPKFTELLAKLGLSEAHARAQAWRAAHPAEKPTSK